MGVHVFPILNPLPPLSPSHPSGSSQCTSPEHLVSCIEPGLAICFTYENIHVCILFFQLLFKYLMNVTLTPRCHLSLCIFVGSLPLLGIHSHLPSSLASTSPDWLQLIFSGSMCVWLALTPLLQVTCLCAELPWGLWWPSLMLPNFVVANSLCP